MSGREAAELLGIKRATLYAYASRGLVRSLPTGSGRERRYLRDDLDRLKARHDARSGHGPVAAGALRWGEPVLESAITGIGARGPSYRGHPAVDLVAAGTSFEATAELLWSGALPASRPPFTARTLGAPARRLAALLPAGAAPLSSLALGVPAIGAREAAGAAPAEDTGPGAGEDERARRLLRRMAALLTLTVDPSRVRAALSADTLARAVILALGARHADAAERAVEAALVLSADHELNPSSFTVRIAASAGADLHACVGAGLSTLSGTRHGCSPDVLEGAVRQARTPRGAREHVRAAVASGRIPHGFGHPLYPAGDPRAGPLLELARAAAPRSALLATLLAMVDAARDLGREHPNLDAGLAAVTLALDVPPRSASALFAAGRAAGWIAHAAEQRAAGFILRPRARYVGP